MALISTRAHGILDYAGGLVSLAAPRLIRDRRAAALLALTGTGTLATSALTDYELGIRRRLPMPVHLLIDAGSGALLLAGARALRRLGAGIDAWGPLALVGVSEVAGAALTDTRPGDRDGGAAAPVGAAMGLGAGAVTEPGAAGVDVLVAQQESAAAAEAARIGGLIPSETGDPAMDPVYQAGGGEQEGWEAAEEELIENATHGDGGGYPERDAFTPEAEADRSSAVYGEADAMPSTEVAEDAGPQ